MAKFRKNIEKLKRTRAARALMKSLDDQKKFNKNIKREIEEDKRKKRVFKAIVKNQKEKFRQDVLKGGLQ